MDYEVLNNIIQRETFSPHNLRENESSIILMFMIMEWGKSLFGFLAHAQEAL